MRKDIEKFIASVSKPGRYTGGEHGVVMKDKNKVDLRVAFCFPDSYEIGMSNLGMRILCGVLNNLDRTWCERVYAPWVDMEDEMRKRNIPLFAHESGDAINEFDIVAFTLQYELCYSTVLNMLDLGGIPLRREDRGEDFPVVLAGGPCAYNPEPMADFVDIFSIGEGEEALPELANLYLKMKDDGTYTKEAFLRAAASELEGFYVPSLYNVEYNPDNTIKSIEPKFDDVPRKVVKRVVEDLDASYVPTSPMTPYIETIHDRVTLEVFRGCVRGCRFCQAGFVCRPVRERSPETLSEQAKLMCSFSGYDEISLSSLSISDYSKIGTLTDKLLEWTNKEKINLSLPSLRADTFTPELMEKISSVRSSAVTFAPEAGTQRLRDIINKNVTEEEILNAAGVAYSAGKDKVKLYFMNGLPGETYDDIAGIADVAKHVLDKYYKTPNRNKRRQPQVTLSVACFIPKPHTPFQWEGQNTFEELEKKQKYLLERITDRKIRYNYHDAKVSHIEAVFARGDRRLSLALETAQKRGVKFDAWDEFFDFDKWMEIFADCGIDPAFYANRTIPSEEILPWDMIDCGVKKEFLIKERNLAHEAMTTPSCREKCSGCGANSLVSPEFCRWCPGHGDESEAESIVLSSATGGSAVGDCKAKLSQREIDGNKSDGKDWGSALSNGTLANADGTDVSYSPVSSVAGSNDNVSSGGASNLKAANEDASNLKAVNEVASNLKVLEKAKTAEAPIGVRVKFEKSGSALYISHLDLAKTFAQVIRRAGIPVWYSEGFNPKPRLVFASSLSVGHSGMREILDFKITEAMTDEEIKDRLEENAPPGIFIREVYRPETKLKNIRWAENEIVFENCKVSDEILSEIEALFDKPVILMKRSKSGEKETDISPLVKSVSARVDSEEKFTVRVVTAADGNTYLNPEYVATAIENNFNVKRDDGYHTITRKRFLTDDGVTEFE